MFLDGVEGRQQVQVEAHQNGKKMMENGTKRTPPLGKIEMAGLVILHHLACTITCDGGEQAVNFVSCKTNRKKKYNAGILTHSSPNWIPPLRWHIDTHIWHQLPKRDRSAPAEGRYSISWFAMIENDTRNAHEEKLTFPVNEHATAQRVPH